MRAMVLGCGSAGSRHATNLVGLGVEVVVADLDERAAAGLAARVGASLATRDDPPRCDLVVVATPTVNHVDDLAWSLAHGADVFVEKPLAASWDQLERARALGRDHRDRVVMVGCNLRFTEGFASLTANLGAVGRPAALLADYGWWLPAWRPAQDYRTGYSARRSLGGGIVLDAIHEIDYALAVAGPAETVSARGACTEVLGVDVEDVADIAIRHVGGVYSHLHLDYLRRRYSRSCTIIGTEGELRWDVPGARVELITEAGADPQTLAAGVDRDPNAQYVAEMRHLLAAIEGRAATCNDIARAAAAVSVALTARDGIIV